MADPAESVHRLKDILVEEVSLVDRAANKRRFLLVKREGDMSELRPNGRGGFTRVAKADDEEETEKAKAPPFGGAKAPPFGKKPEDGEEKRKAEGEDEEETEKAKKKPPFPPAKDGEEKRVFENEEGANAEVKSQKADDDAAEDLEHIAQDLLTIAEEMEGEPSDVHMKKIASAHKKMGGMIDKYMKKTATKNAVEKVGRKMSAARLGMFKESLQTLQSLLSELMDTPGKASSHEPDPGDPQAKPKGWSPTNPSDAPTNAMGAAAVKQLAKMINGVIEVNKAQAREIAQLKKGIAPSNSIPVEKSNGRGQEDVSWPMDMNAPTDRGSVAKGESFYDGD